MKYILSIFFSLCLGVLNAQEIKCTVEINSSQLAISDPTYFDNIKQVIYDFINTRKWTRDKFKVDERVECTILINLTNEISTGNYEGTLQITSRRPVYGSTYYSPVINHLDNDVSFQFEQFTILEFSENTFLSNLSSLLSYYVYMSIAFDYDSFSPNGGTPYFQTAQSIVNNAQSSDGSGWKAYENNRNRYWIIENMMSPRFENIRKCIYMYHREGLDLMSESPEEARKKIYESLEMLKPVYENSPTSINLKIFFNAKADELVNIFSDSPREEKTKIIDLLNAIDPVNTNKYQKILDSK
tara:strand:- start:1599 stop:2495 length:897 start_codon:yes stop_codon:yes gene_type:complete